MSLILLPFVVHYEYEISVENSRWFQAKSIRKGFEGKTMGDEMDESKTMKIQCGVWDYLARRILMTKTKRDTI